jgi:diguanylate cyclase (GGDEF)-like protein/PAS domain S-box-containing protein
VELKTVMLLLAVGSFIFALLLVIFKVNNNNPKEVPYWITAKMLQAAGSFMLFLRTQEYDGLTVAANAVLLTGCAYEAWAVRFLAGKSIRHKTHISITAGIIIACVITLFVPSPFRRGIVFLMQALFFLLPCIFLLSNYQSRHSLRYIMAVCYLFTAFTFFVASVICLVFPDFALSPTAGRLYAAIPGLSFGIFLISGFILLMLAKEKSDIEVAKIQETLKKSEIRYRHIVETAIEGILVFDRDYKITFANRNMAAMLGYTVEELTGMSCITLFPDNMMDVYYSQENARKHGKDSVYETALRKKNGEINWFLVSAKAVLDDEGAFEGSFAMLTDINARKEMELLLAESNKRLTELSNTDSLTGIANRRRFDDTLEHEFSRLKRSKSKLSVIMFDIDHFKEYNDYYGHVMGDECLRKIGRAFADCINRNVDLAARYGGEEFACILPDTDLENALKIAENIRQAIYNLKIVHCKSAVCEYVTASFGVATVGYTYDSSTADIIEFVDMLMYKAKSSGKNNIKYGELE